MTLQEAFGQTPEVEKGLLAEQLYHDWAKRVYDIVEYFPDDYQKQVSGIDFEIKKNTWRRSYGVDVKGNLTPKGYFYVDNSASGWLRGSNKKNDRVCHICPETGWALEYDRKDMKNYLENNQTELVSLNAMSEDVKPFTRRFKVK